MPQAIQIETQAADHSLSHPHRQTAAWGARRELAFDREDALDQRATPVELLREGWPHLGSVPAPSFLSTLRGNNTLRSALLTNRRCDFSRRRIRHRTAQPDAGLLGRGFDHRGQIRAVVPRAASCGLRQQELLIQVRHRHPL